MIAGPIQNVCAVSTINTRRAPTMRSRGGIFHVSRRPQLGSCAVPDELSYDIAHGVAKPLGGKPASSLYRLTAQFVLEGRVLDDARDSFAGILHRVKSQPAVPSDN